MMLLAAAMALAPLAAAASSSGQEAAVTMYRVTGGAAVDECGQVSLDQKFEATAEEWLMMKQGSCGSVGYEVPKGNRSLSLPFVGEVEITLFKKADPLAELKKISNAALGQVLSQAMGVPTAKLPACCKSCAEGEKKFYEVNAEEKQCSELCMQPAAAMMFQFLKPSLNAAEADDACASVGYGVYSETVSKAPQVNADVYHWGEPPAKQPEGWVVIHSAQGVECFQAVAEKKYADTAANFAGFKEGGCADAGFTEEQDAQVPSMLTGEVTLTLFKKPGALSLADALRFTKDLVQKKDSPKREPSLVDLALVV